MLYHILNTIVDIEPSKFLRISDSRTRGAKSLYIPQEYTKHPVLHAHFFPRTTREWNSLPTSYTDSPSLEGFKRGLGYLTGLDPSACDPHRQLVNDFINHSKILSCGSPLKLLKRELIKLSSDWTVMLSRALSIHKRRRRKRRRRRRRSARHKTTAMAKQQGATLCS